LAPALRRTMKLGPVRHDTRCAVCWGTMKKVKVVSPCLHRFCAKCVEEHIRKLYVPFFIFLFLSILDWHVQMPLMRRGRAYRPYSQPTNLSPSHQILYPEPYTLHPKQTTHSNNYCPTCRVHIPSRRALRDDPDFDKGS
jgi:hypothetical protein